MLPLRDRLPTRTFPFINYLLIAANVLFFLWQTALVESGYADLGTEFGFVPYRFNVSPITAAPTILTSMFMHGGFGHLGGNMLALWIFGDNVEDAMGHFRYAAFYLLGGIAAAITQMGIDPFSQIPMVGASGAIAAVMAGYLVLYPRSPITVLNPIPLLWFFMGIFWEFPAWVIALEFFALNLWSGFGALGGRGGAGGVAFFAHIGGFITGLILVGFFTRGKERRQSERWSGWRPPNRRGSGGWQNSRGGGF
jgi:membrane associated rhomboid family serine protease